MKIQPMAAGEEMGRRGMPKGSLAGFRGLVSGFEAVGNVGDAAQQAHTREARP